MDLIILTDSQIPYITLAEVWDLMDILFNVCRIDKWRATVLSRTIAPCHQAVAKSRFDASTNKRKTICGKSTLIIKGWEAEPIVPGTTSFPLRNHALLRTIIEFECGSVISPGGPGRRRALMTGPKTLSKPRRPAWNCRLTKLANPGFRSTSPLLLSNGQGGVFVWFLRPAPSVHGRSQTRYQSSNVH